MLAVPGLAGQFCTITSSNIPEIEVGSKVIYASAAGDPIPGQLNSDLIIDGPGNNTAYGHVVLDVLTGTGVVTLSGGTGVFKHFHAQVAVTPLGGPNFAWDGTVQLQPAQSTGRPRGHRCRRTLRSAPASSTARTHPLKEEP